MQQFMDRVLTDAERVEAEVHLDECAYCRKRYRFEETLRVFVRQAVAAEPMPVELKKKLSELRTPLQ
jgi:predicted anti-sigma-YlaC factor YlaD